MALTGSADREPLGPPAPLIDGLLALGGALATGSAVIGMRVEVDPVALLGERAALLDLTRHGAISCGGSTRLLDAADGVVALTLARDEDIELVPAWLELAGALRGDPWPLVADVVSTRDVAWLVDRSSLLGLAVAGLGSVAARRSDGGARAEAATPWPIEQSWIRAGRPHVDVEELLVVDLSALWAGPLCGQLLAAAGARVVKVESTSRPDGARSGPRAFFDLLNADKQSVVLDFRERRGRDLLRRLLGAADVVIEASRPRALEQLGIRARDLLAADDGPSVWVSITGYGRTGPGADRIAYGDVAAVAGGLVAGDDRGPCFCADAVADPLTGLVAAVGALGALASGDVWLLDVAMGEVAAHWTGPSLPTGGATYDIAAPRARSPQRRAPRLGHDTDVVLASVLG